MNTASNLTAKPQHPVRELLARYRAIFSAAWSLRHDMAGPQRLADEAAFLPAALSLQDSPVHPAPRRLALALIILFTVALLWACLGKIDIVAIAPGRIIVSDRTKTIQPLEASVVRKVLVKDGDRVKAGQVLVELDPTNANADQASVQEQLGASTSEAQRTAALLQALQSRSSTVRPASVEGAANRAQLQTEWQDINAKLAKLDAEAVRRRAEISTVREAITQLETSLPLAKAREADYKALAQDQLTSAHSAQDKTRERLELESDLSTQRAKLTESLSALKETEQSKAAYSAETQRTLQDRNAVATSKAQRFGCHHG